MLACLLSFQSADSLAQGNLTPPGAPSPTMHTLDQIYDRGDPRIRITNSSSTVTISIPGSYFLTQDLTVSSGNAINITTNGVTLDLGGHTITSTAASAVGAGVLLNSGLKNVVIRNGNIVGGVTNNAVGVYSGTGFAYGIYYSSTAPVNVCVSKVSVIGCLYYGIDLNAGDATLVEDCFVRTVGSYGILASTVKNCTAVECGYTSISGDQVSDCRGETTFGSYGLFGVNVQNSYGSSASSGYGLYAYVALNCAGTSASSYGLYAYYSAQNCQGQSTSGTGLFSRNVNNCYGSSSSDTGIECSGTAINSSGVASSGLGLDAYCAENCYGNGVSGLSASTALNCLGVGSNGDGVYAGLTAMNCFGSTGAGTGLVAFIASFCHGTATTGTDLSVTHNINSY